MNKRYKGKLSKYLRFGHAGYNKPRWVIDGTGNNVSRVCVISKRGLPENCCDEATAQRMIDCWNACEDAGLDDPVNEIPNLLETEAMYEGLCK